MTAYPQGSTWRRWDVHVHTPETAAANNFGDWEEYLSAIEAHPDVKAIGVTDYMTITNYSKLRRYKEAGRIENVDLLFPNIEFRIAPPSDKATALNIHLLISPDDPIHEAEISNALARLTWRYDGKNYSCLPDQLCMLGRAFNPSATSDRLALEVGVMQFKVDFTQFKQWHANEPWLNRNSLIAVAAGKDGLSGFQRDGGWASYRDEITRFSHILFSGRPGEREFWLGQRTAEDLETVRRLGGFKPCLHGSDAHEIGKLFRPDDDRFCWIKADPTFEGLKQVLYEPGGRVHIGPTVPLYHDEARVLRSIRLSNAGGWFTDVSLALNPGLVSVIGQKGSGKSALAEVIAYAAGSWVTDEPGSFLRRAKLHLNDLIVELNWADGTRERCRLGDAQPSTPKVRYLSQRFVERLCADDHIGTELVHAIEDVIYSYIDPTDTLNASSFEELRALRTSAIRDEESRLRGEVIGLIREECALRESAAKLPEKQARIKTLAEERDGLVKQMPRPASEAEAKVQADLQTYRHRLSAAQQAAAVQKQKLQKITDLRTRRSTFALQMARHFSEITPILDEIGVPVDERDRFKPSFDGDAEPILARQEAAIRRAIDALEGAANAPAEGTMRWLVNHIDNLTKQESADKTRQERIKTIQSRIATIGTETERLKTEIAQIEGPDRLRIDAAREERLNAYVAFFRNLKREQEALEELYAPISKRLHSETASRQERELEFSIRWHADVAKWLARGVALFDQRKAIPYDTVEGLAAATQEILVPAWTSGNPDLIKPAMEKFLQPFRNRNLPPSKYMRAGATVQDVFEWLYEVQHVRLTYGLKYNGVELEKLSPGTKGIVLLILYLGMDVADTRPLIVDQPDENLDNESIYELLTAYFKEAKRRRQIILITHNPNLVVNADSEQIIVATAARQGSGFPHITYRAGSLEHSMPDDNRVRQAVCRILEGGSDAFKRRERRYALS